MATDGVPSTQSDSFGESRRSIKAQLETALGDVDPSQSMGSSGVVSGSRLQQTDRTAKSESGSPPSVVGVHGAPLELLMMLKKRTGGE
jgi:hypothetical protein